MIDWFSVVVACDYEGAINGGQVLTIDADGTIEFTKERGRVVEGSYSSKMLIRGEASPRVEYIEGNRVEVEELGCRLYISGNPSKFLQGHNLFGSDDLPYLVYRVMTVIADRLGLPASDNDRWSWCVGAFFVSRVDVTSMFDVDTPDRVRDWLVAAAQVAHSRYQPAGNKYAGTLYIGQNSRRVSLKIYDKLAEMQKPAGRLPDDLPKEWHHLLIDWAFGKLRVEATFRAMWLNDKNMALGLAWRPGVAQRLLDERLGGLEMSDTMKLTDELVGDIPRNLLGIYEMWRAGRDLTTLYSREHLSRVRSKLLPYGIDIKHVRPREVVTENQYIMGAPLKSFLPPGGGAPVPEWAKGTSLYASPDTDPDDSKWDSALEYMRNFLGRSA
jgi:II/X family phage/plasmid replication protein